MDLNTLLVFAEVVRNQSFTKAAQELGIEKSTVSSKVADLENRLETRLLTRSTRSVALTKAGEGYYRYCRQIIANAEEADEFVRTFSSEPQGVLRISSPKGLGRILFCDLFDSFMKSYEKIDVDIVLTRDEVNIVRDRFDVALRVVTSPLKDSSLIAKNVLDFRWGFFASSEYLAKHGSISTMKQLEHHPFIHFVDPYVPATKMQVQKAGKTYFPEYKNRLVINEIDASIEAIHMGLGVGILPTSSVRQEVESGSLVELLPDYALPSASICAIYPSRRWLSSKLQVFLDFLEQWGKRNTD